MGVPYIRYCTTAKLHLEIHMLMSHTDSVYRTSYVFITIRLACEICQNKIVKIRRERYIFSQELLNVHREAILRESELLTECIICCNNINSVRHAYDILLLVDK